MRPGELCAKPVASALVVSYTESASSVPRLPEIEDYVQDVVRGKIGSLCLHWRS